MDLRPVVVIAIGAGQFGGVVEVLAEEVEAEVGPAVAVAVSAVLVVAAAVVVEQAVVGDAIIKILKMV